MSWSEEIRFSQPLRGVYAEAATAGSSLREREANAYARGESDCRTELEAKHYEEILILRKEISELQETALDGLRKELDAWREGVAALLPRMAEQMLQKAVGGLDPFPAGLRDQIEAVLPEGLSPDAAITVYASPADLARLQREETDEPEAPGGFRFVEDPGLESGDFRVVSPNGTLDADWRERLARIREQMEQS